jgi:hypothetical protein
MTTDTLRFWRISDEVLKQALLQLDPNHLGIAVMVIQCMPPSPIHGKVCSLRERTRKGTFPWTADLERDALFLGLESLSGYSVEVCHIVSDDDLRHSKPFPAVRGSYEVSAAAHPIRFEGRIAGCLLASSTQPKYFSQERLNLLAVFSDLISLAFDEKDFYPASMIELRVMPEPEIQQSIFATFHQLVTAKLQQMAHQPQQLSNVQIEMQVWQEIEAALLSHSSEEAPQPHPVHDPCES